MYETLDQLVRGVIKPSDLPPSGIADIEIAIRSDEEADSERQDCFLISHLFGVMGHGQRKKAEAQQLSIEDIV